MNRSKRGKEPGTSATKRNSKSNAAFIRPSYYRAIDRDGNPIEAIQVIEAFKLGFNLGNALKYLCRADGKGVPKEDLVKAAFYINREIENRK